MSLLSFQVRQRFDAEGTRRFNVDLQIRWGK